MYYEKQICSTSFMKNIPIVLCIVAIWVTCGLAVGFQHSRMNYDAEKTELLPALNRVKIISVGTEHKGLVTVRFVPFNKQVFVNLYPVTTGGMPKKITDAEIQVRLSSQLKLNSIGKLVLVVDATRKTPAEFVFIPETTVVQNP
jgi:hypothetical protein